MARKKQRAKKRSNPKPRKGEVRVPKPLGRPSSFKPEYVEQAKKLCEKFAATEFQIAQFFGVTTKCIWEWRMRYPEFGNAIKLNKEEADKLVEQSLFHRARGYSHESEHILADGTSIPITKHYPPDTAAAFIWLKNRRPQDWRDRQELENNTKVEITVKGGLPKKSTEEKK